MGRGFRPALCRFRTTVPKQLGACKHIVAELRVQFRPTAFADANGEQGRSPLPCVGYGVLRAGNHRRSQKNTPDEAANVCAVGDTRLLADETGNIQDDA